MRLPFPTNHDSLKQGKEINLILLSCYEVTSMAPHEEERQQPCFPIAPKGMVFLESQRWKYSNKGLTTLPTGLGLKGQ